MLKNIFKKLFYLITLIEGANEWSLCLAVYILHLISIDEEARLRVEGAIGDARSLNLANGQNVVRCLLGINPRKIGTKIDNIVSPMKTNN